MKIVKALLILVVAFTMLGMPHPAAAQIYTYTSGFQVQNLSSDDALITLYYYSQQTDGSTGGDQALATDDTILGLGSKTYFPIHADTGFKGSVVIASSTPLASIVNLVANGIGYSSYVGFSSGSTEVNLPLLMKDNSGYTTWVSVQNTNSTNDASVSIAYSDGTSAGPIVIKPNASFIFNHGLESHSLAIFSAKITSNQPVAAVVVQEGATRFKTISSWTGFNTAGNVNAIMPLINQNNSGYITGAQIQNVGTQSTEIEVTYTPVPGIGTSCKETRTIAAGASETFGLFAFQQTAPTAVSDCTKARFIGSGQITGNTNSQPVVVIVNQMTNTTINTIAGAYASFNPTEATDTVVLPLIHDRNSGWYSGFTLVNVGEASVDVTCTFTNTTYTVTGTLAPGEVLLDIQKYKIADRYIGSGSCKAVGGTSPKIVAVVNEVAPGAGDTLLVYEGINVTVP